MRIRFFEFVCVLIPVTCLFLYFVYLTREKLINAESAKQLKLHPTSVYNHPVRYGPSPEQMHSIMIRGSYNQDREKIFPNRNTEYVGNPAGDFGR